MKQTILLTTIIAIFTIAKPADATAQVRVNVNIGMQPAWGPSGYDYAKYYYMPDIDVYYDVSRKTFVYFDAGRWMFGMQLPYRFRGYDMYRGYKVVINERDPWMRCDYYRRSFAPYRNYYGRQVAIRDRRDYYRDYDSRKNENNSRNRRSNDEYAQNNGRDNDHHNDRDRRH